MEAFDEICGYEKEKRELAQIADILKHPEHYEPFGAEMPSGLLLDGEPGLGKTLMARCLIKASGLASYECRKNANSESMPKMIRDTFLRASENAPAIILLDDMDKLSNSTYELRDTEEYVTVQSCIDEFKGRGVFVIATVNEARKLPRSLRREGRFDRVIRLEAPRRDEVELIVKRYLDKASCRLDLEIGDIADMMGGHSCSFLETVVNEAGLAAGFEQADAIRVDHVVRAFARTEAKEPLSVLGAESEPASLQEAGPSERAQVAFHEAGHIVASELEKPGSILIGLITGQQGHLSGLTRGGRGRQAGTHAESLGLLRIALAGGVAVEQRFGVPAVGSAEDYDKARSLARDLLEGSALVGMHLAGNDSYSDSESTRYVRELCAAAVLELVRWEVRESLTEHAERVCAVAERLYEKGYILSKDIAVAMGR